MRQNDLDDHGLDDWPRKTAISAALSELDCSNAGLGPPCTWPSSLKSAAALLLRLPMPAFLLWGERSVQLYNDACLPLLGERHPAALGQPFAASWPTLWRDHASLRRAIENRKPCTLHDLCLEGATGAARHALCCMPMPDERGLTGGLLLTLHDEAPADGAGFAVRDERLCLLEEVFRSAPTFVHVLNGPDFVIESANAAFYRLAGRPDLLGRPLFRALPEMLSARYQGLLTGVLQTGEPFIGREQLVRLGGAPGREPEERYMDLVYLRLGDSPCLLGYGADVTDRVHARQEAITRLKESEAQLSAIFSRAAVGLSELSLDGRFLRVNDTLCEMLGRSREDLLGVPAAEVTHQEDLPNTVAALQRVAITGERTSLDKRYLRPDGSVVYANSALTLLHDERGNPRSFLAVTVDLTERRSAEEALRESEEHFRYTVELNPQITWTADPRGSIIASPQRWIDWTGSSALGDGWRRSVHPEDLPMVEAAWKASLDSGQPPDIEFRLRMRGGHYRWVRARAYPRRDAGGRIVRWYGNIEDIHDRRLAEEALRYSEELHRFAAEAGHIGNWDLDIASGALMLAPQMAALLGYPAEHMVLPAAQWKSLVLHEDRGALDAAIRIAVKNAERVDIEYRVRHRDGTIRWLYSRGAAVRSDGGSVIRLRGAALDITERKAADAALRASEERYRVLIELNPDAVLVDAGERIVYANPAALRILGATSTDELIGRAPTSFIEPRCRAAVRASLDQASRHGVIPPLSEQRWHRLDGSVIDVQLSLGPVYWEGAQATQMLLRDISERKRTEDALRISNERLKLVIEGSGEGIWDWDIADNRYVFSGRLKRLLGWDAVEPRDGGKALRRAIHPDDQMRVWSALRAYMEGRASSYACEFRIRTQNRGWRWMQSRGIIVARDADGKPQLMTGTMADISGKKEAEEQIWRHANFDGLTGLPNRRLFRDRLDQEVRKAARHAHRIALLFIDLDRFKQVNDLLGHDAGDMLLAQASQRLKSCVRDSDTVARLGGDEFTVILTELESFDHVEQVCQKILETLETPFNIGKEVAYMSGSVGVTIYPDDAMRSDELIRKADQAMYAAKHAGKNRFSYFTQAMDEKAHLRLRLASELRGALSAGQLEVRYQPVVELASQRIVKAEALLRWHHPRLGLVEPASFIPLAEETGMINQIGNWVFKQAADCCKVWSTHLGEPFQIGVNKSPIQFLSPKEESDWRAHLEELGLPGSSISIEITEGLLLHASSSVNNRLLEYRDAGIQVAIDDFGTGYSSMAYLKKFDIDYLKIDQSFVRDMDTDPGDRTIAESIIVMAHKLGLKVIAEGIETEAQRRLLVEAGCDYGQGFLFAKALTSADFEQLLLAGNQRAMLSA
ncbi:PAS domain S-box protein [Noviherbaspirillum pedocola]|uniref:PAS domain S-box protein n=1 Tax=Noviherbaspirillum pedocola TaxID=2801341 RepID=A0A934SXX7_9BURK|nr:PAS domain S-box protein [Noviherbaspirillum pedocola]MBK4738886.1 PAS domain S-box protein [Noviherbaspirillum pedocola]